MVSEQPPTDVAIASSEKTLWRIEPVARSERLPGDTQPFAHLRSRGDQQLRAWLSDRMARATTISDVIAGIYDAGLYPSRWTDVVESISGYVGGQACGLFSKNSISKFGVTHYYCGADPRYIQLYAETYCKFDPLNTR